MHACCAARLRQVAAACESGDTAAGKALLEAAHGSSRADLARLAVKTKADRDDGLGAAPPLFRAGKHGRMAVAELLLTAGAEVNDGLTGNGATPLIAACGHGHLEQA